MPWDWGKVKKKLEAIKQQKKSWPQKCFFKMKLGSRVRIVVLESDDGM